VSLIDSSLARRFLLLASITATLWFALSAQPTNAWAEPGESRFGDSTWVAPNLYPEGDPSENGPRVNEADKEKGWETALRTPFRVVFFPLRLLGDGFEKVADLGETYARNHGLDRAPSGHLPIPSVKGIDPVTYIRVRVYGSVYT